MWFTKPNLTFFYCHLPGAWQSPSFWILRQWQKRKQKVFQPSDELPYIFFPHFYTTIKILPLRTSEWCIYRSSFISLKTTLWGRWGWRSRLAQDHPGRFITEWREPWTSGSKFNSKTTTLSWQYSSQVKLYKPSFNKPELLPCYLNYSAFQLSLINSYWNIPLQGIQMYTSITI